MAWPEKGNGNAIIEKMLRRKYFIHSLWQRIMMWNFLTTFNWI